MTHSSDSVFVLRWGAHALETKCFFRGSGVGVKATSRLISRLKYRQFGFLVTTLYVSDQAYKEIKDDGHPVVVISANDIANILIEVGISTVRARECAM